MPDTKINLFDKFKSSNIEPDEQLIKDIAYQVLGSVRESQDEIYLLGSGRGAYTVCAVAALLHHISVPQYDLNTRFEELYKHAMVLQNAIKNENQHKGEDSMQHLRNGSTSLPKIKLVGIFDSIVTSADNHRCDMSVTTSIQHFRHAMAFTEARLRLSSNARPNLETADMTDRTSVQAWFMGTHKDLVGGELEDGLSLYPLQWMVIEGTRCGLVLTETLTADVNNTLSLVFPQYMGKVPNLELEEQVQWKIRYANNLVVSMYDLQSCHLKGSGGKASHAMHFSKLTNNSNPPRQPFSSHVLTGWTPSSMHGTIIHPSMYCILEKNPRFLDQPRIKDCRERLIDFEVNCMNGDRQELSPWLCDSQLLTSDVKAFRILVCGKTGVGKSTLINRVFGLEMTEESQTYAQGKHDIKVAFESPDHPGLMIHDSRGWQAGSNDELVLIEQFLRHRAFQQDAAEALHVIWFCVDADVSRIEAADKLTFETIARYSNHVPVFVVGTKKDKVMGYRKMEFLEKHMERTGDYRMAIKLAEEDASRMADDQFMELRRQLAELKDYKADG
ncbi:hypothetical protein LTR66_015028, partial [Elasticomyces elasticus]